METCSVFRHLILDDDVRVEFSKAHEHARTIASDVLVELTELLPGSFTELEFISSCDSIVSFNCSKRTESSGAERNNSIIGRTGCAS